MVKRYGLINHMMHLSTACLVLNTTASCATLNQGGAMQKQLLHFATFDNCRVFGTATRRWKVLICD